MKAEQLRAVVLEECGLSLGVPVLVAVSGGPDSLCLLDGLNRNGFETIAAHFDHALRPDSAEDARFVSEFAAGRTIPFVTRREDVSAYARQERMSVEEAARDLRYRFLFDAARGAGAQAVAVGHNADDQVETLLMHLLRGTGLRGLAGMPYRAVMPSFDSSIPLVRPLLPFWREEILAYCAERGLDPRFDTTNQDTAFFRNRLRHELIPLLAQYNPRAREALWRAAQTAAADAEVVEAATQETWAAVFAAQEDGAVALQAAVLRQQPPGLQHALLRMALAALQPALRDVDFAAVARARQWLLRPGSGSVDLVDGITAFLEGDLLWLARPGASLPQAWPQMEAGELLLPVPGSVTVAPGWRLSAAWEDAEKMPSVLTAGSPWQACLHGDDISQPLRIRAPRPGDRFSPLGMEGHTVKISDFWVNQKVPRRARAGWPLVVIGSEIAWVPGYRLAHSFRVREETRRVAVLRLNRED